MMREARDLVYNIINCSKPIISRHPWARRGCGLVAALLADTLHPTPHRSIIDATPASGWPPATTPPSVAAAVRHGQAKSTC